MQSIRFLPLRDALAGQPQLHLYHPGNPDHLPPAGLALLKQIALDLPVYVVRLLQHWPHSVLSRVPHTWLREGALIENVMAYAVAFERDGQAHLEVVAVSPLQRPPPSIPKPPRQRRNPEHSTPVPLVRKRKRGKRAKSHR
ncbi:hypothetical protein [Deinococcus hopiensis]|uniref:Uncharacterized protein n=1 Tax=Deinococcus hopiensis KR-140 TaxID=695939 RepID=A0A1W1UY51_9DEIO|nr:hypothetical protein [Deinococcus hopiensis]SMB85890.1 hypothetical protein SAMN00790413_03589 [Deinococcus hopiensis KR-140]